MMPLPSRLPRRGLGTLIAFTLLFSLSPARAADTTISISNFAFAPVETTIPVGTTVHCVEMMPGKGAQIARAAGAGVQLLAREGDYAQLRMRSGEIRRVHVNCRATIGEVGNEEHNLRQIGKAGANRWRGIRPTVRGETMNPVDHPLGGRTRGNRHPVSPWGQPAKGKKTRSNKRTQSMIVRSRHKKA